MSLHMLNVKKATWKVYLSYFWWRPLPLTVYILKKEVNKLDGVMEGKKENNKARKESKR